MICCWCDSQATALMFYDGEHYTKGDPACPTHMRAYARTYDQHIICDPHHMHRG